MLNNLGRETTMQPPNKQKSATLQARLVERLAELKE